jgi:hypothetical protein
MKRLAVATLSMIIGMDAAVADPCLHAKHGDTFVCTSAYFAFAMSKVAHGLSDPTKSSDYPLMKRIQDALLAANQCFVVDRWVIMRPDSTEQPDYGSVEYGPFIVVEILGRGIEGWVPAPELEPVPRDYAERYLGSSCPQ